VFGHVGAKKDLFGRRSITHVLRESTMQFATVRSPNCLIGASGPPEDALETPGYHH